MVQVVVVIKITTQAKAAISLLMSVVVAVSLSEIAIDRLWQVPTIIVAFMIEITLIFWRSEEEKHYQKYVSDKQALDDIHASENTKSEKLKSQDRIRKLRKKAKKVSAIEKTKKIDSEKYLDIMNTLTKFRRGR